MRNVKTGPAPPRHQRGETTHLKWLHLSVGVHHRWWVTTPSKYKRKTPILTSWGIYLWMNSQEMSHGSPSPCQWINGAVWLVNAELGRGHPWVIYRSGSPASGTRGTHHNSTRWEFGAAVAIRLNCTPSPLICHDTQQRHEEMIWLIFHDDTTMFWRREHMQALLSLCHVHTLQVSRNSWEKMKFSHLNCDGKFVSEMRSRF